MIPRILVIDGDATIRDSILAFLHDCHYQTLEADSATRALESVVDHEIDAVVCALDLADQSGLELLSTFKQQNSHLPVIMTAPSMAVADILAALRLGADDFLDKTHLNLSLLEQALKRVFERTDLEDENRAYRVHLEKANTELTYRLNELRNDQQAGRQVQMRMLPEPLTASDVTCQHRLVPSLMLSGDFLDFFLLNDDRLVFYIADVSGHGASSAFVTVLLKNMTYRLRRNLHRGSSDDVVYPDRVLQRLNAELLASELDKHMTMFYGVLCLKTLQLTYSVGGHFPMPLLMTKEGTSSLEGRAMPVGMFKEASYPLHQINLPDDFNLLLFSDGILEVIESEQLADKEAQLQQQVQSSQGSLEQLADQLGIHTDIEVPDDIAMMSIRRGQL